MVVVEPCLSSPKNTPAMVPQACVDKGYGPASLCSSLQCTPAVLLSFFNFMGNSGCSVLYTLPDIVHSILQPPEIASVQLAPVHHLALAAIPSPPPAGLCLRLRSQGNLVLILLIVLWAKGYFAQIQDLESPLPPQFKSANPPLSLPHCGICPTLFSFYFFPTRFVVNSVF